MSESNVITRKRPTPKVAVPDVFGPLWAKYGEAITEAEAAVVAAEVATAEIFTPDP